MSDTLTRLAEVLEARKGAAPDSSYVASLYHKGLNKILEKVGEESVETILAAKDAASSGDCTDLIYETADLWFHSLVMLAALGQHPQAVLDELDRRWHPAAFVLRAGFDDGLIARLRTHPGWRELPTDRDSVLFVRASPETGR